MALHLVNILLVFHSTTDWSTRVLRLYCMQQQGLEFITMRQNKDISQYNIAWGHRAHFLMASTKEACLLAASWWPLLAAAW